jgi:restriction endonuclease S subunit
MKALTLSKSELDADLRLDVGFNLRARHAQQILSLVTLPLSRLKDISDLISDGFRASTVANEGIPLLRVTNVLSHELDLENLVYVSWQDVYPRYRVQQGDILLTKTAVDFRACMVPVDADGAVFSSDLVRIRPQAEYPAVFLTYFLNSTFGRHTLKAHSYGNAVRRLRVQDIRGLDIPWPPPSFASAITDLDKRAAELDKEAKERISQAVGGLYAAIDMRAGHVTKIKSSFTPLRSQLGGRWDVPFGYAIHLTCDLTRTSLFRRLAALAQIAPSTLRGFQPQQRVSFIQLGNLDLEFFTIGSHEESTVAELPARVRQPLSANQVLLANNGYNLGTVMQPVVVVPERLDGALSTNALTALIFPDNPFYWAMCLKHPLVLAQIASSVSGSIQPYLTKQDMDNLLLPVLADAWRDDFQLRAEAASRLRQEARMLRQQASQQVDRFLEESLGKKPGDW